MTPIMHVMTDTSAVSNPSAELVQPLLGFKNPAGTGAYLATVLAVSGAAGAQPLETVTDAIIIATESPSTRRLLPVMARLTGYNVVNDEFDPLSVQFNDDAIDMSTDGLLSVAAAPYLFNGVTSDRSRSLSAANLAAFSGIGGLIAAGPGEWAVNSEPAVSTQATATRAAGAAGVRHVCRSLHFSLAAVVGQTIISARVRDGATGAGTILWSQQVVIPAGSAVNIQLSGLNIVGSAATAMTFEWSGAPVATNFQTAGGTGYSTI